METFKLNGTGTMTGGEFESVNINGVVKCTGAIKTGKMDADGSFQCDGDIIAQTICIDGIFKCKGSLTADFLDCDGMAEFESFIKAKKIDADGMINVKNGTRIEAEEIYCNGGISVEGGEISADILDSDGYICAREIVGDKIRIKSRAGKFWSFILRMNSSSKVDLIEATTIDLKGVTAKTVNGKDIRIGSRCVIENLDCSGTLQIDSDARVNHITGDYVKK